MPNVLLVATDPGETAPLRDELERRGHAVAVAPGSFYALTLLERNAPDLLVAWPDIGEPAAEELSAILAQDPATARVRLAVLCQDGHRPAVPRGVALIEAGPTAELATLLERLIHAPAGGPGDDPEAARRPAAEGGSLVGRLDTIQLVHLVQALAQLRRTGCLRVMFFTAESSTYFCEGRLLHATFGNLVAEEALTESLLEAEAQPGALFAFDRYDEERIGRVPRTIASRLESVLLEASAQIDERRDAAAPPGRR